MARLEIYMLFATTACGAGLCYSLWSLSLSLKRTKEALIKEQENRKSERNGRIRIEQELRKVQLEAAAGLMGAQHGGGDRSGDKSHRTDPSSISSFPFKPIGYLRSCFSQRNGTPRQPLLVPLARGRLQLVSDVPASSLEGLELYSHVWIIYIFHENTDLVKTLQGDRSSKHSKINVPRLNGGRMGVLATRSPHRPVPIGLSVAQVLEVKGNTVLLGGADIVDGSPVLDIKPYVPFCDGVTSASAPAWVAAEAEEEPLKLQAVHIPPLAQRALVECWRRQRGRSLYGSSEEWIEFVKQVLSRDIRALHKRLGLSKQEGLYHVILENVDVSYVMEDETVVLKGAILGGAGGRVQAELQSTTHTLGSVDIP